VLVISKFLQRFDAVGWAASGAGADCLHMVQLMPLPSQNPIILWQLNPDWFYLSGTGWFFLVHTLRAFVHQAVKLVVALLRVAG